MRKPFYLLLIVLVASVFLLPSCNTDTQGPKIYLLGADGKIIQDIANDTIVLLFTKYVDPGVLVEDNATQTSVILLEDDSEDEFNLNSEGYLRRAEDVEITYTATDEAANVSTKIRYVKIANISVPFADTYTTTRDALYIVDTSYKTNVSADSRVPGRLRFPKVYAHYWNGEKSYFSVSADLYHTDLSDEASDDVAYMGTSANKEDAFFRGMTYEEATDSILSFTMLKIDAQFYTDTLDNQVYIAGRADEHGDPLSRIEYLEGTKTITRIVLELNVTKNSQVDQVTEFYVPF